MERKKNKDQHDLTATLIDLLKKVRGRIALNCIEIAQGSKLLGVHFLSLIVFFCIEMISKENITKY